MYYDPGSKMYYDGHSIDSNSGIAIQLCPLPIGGISLPCLAPLPAQTQLQENACPGTAGGEPLDVTDYLTARVTGPEGGPRNCHVNAALEPVANYHVYSYGRIVSMNSASGPTCGCARSGLAFSRGIGFTSASRTSRRCTPSFRAVP